MGIESPVTIKRRNSLEKARSVRWFFSSNFASNVLSPGSSFTRVTTPKIAKQGHFVNEKFLDCESESLTLIRQYWNDSIGKSRGNHNKILFALNVVADFIQKKKGCSLSSICKSAEEFLKVNSIIYFSHVTMMKHWKIFSESPELYIPGGRLFAPALGRPRKLSINQEKEIVRLLKSRIQNKLIRFPTLDVFLDIIEKEFGICFSRSWMSRFCIRNSFVYGKPIETKNGTRYHDSPLVLKERVSFLLDKLWYLAWEQEGKVCLFTHDESWINEKPSGLNVWSFEDGKKSISIGNKILGRRFAFSSMFSVQHGLLVGTKKFDLCSLETKIEEFKSYFDSLSDYSSKETLHFAEGLQLIPNEPLTISSKNKFVVPDVGFENFFMFDVKTSSQNKGVSRQMNSESFLQSVEIMIRNAAAAVSPSTTVVIQLDNATYHREAEDLYLRSITNPYPVKVRKNINNFDDDDSENELRPQSMIELLKLWKFKPVNANDSWWNPISVPHRRITRNTLSADSESIRKLRALKDAHKSEITRYFRIAPQYRNQKTRVEALVERLKIELNQQIIILWGARGHSELAEIEFSWNFMKIFTKDLNPINAKQTTQLLRLSSVLDFSNRRSWRDLTLINMYAYLFSGYLDRPLFTNLMKNKKNILEQMQNLFSSISIDYTFTEEGRNQFLNSYVENVANQLTYQEIISA